MTKEEKEIADTVKANEEQGNPEPEKTDADEAKEPLEGVEEPEKEIDYEARLKEERERGRQEGAADLAFKLRDKKRKGEPEPEDDIDVVEEEDKPITKKELSEILKKNTQETEKRLLSGQISDKVKKFTSNESEAQLIIEIHKNRTFPENLSLDEQLEECYAIANKKRFPALNSEMKRALGSKETKSDDPSGSYREPQKGTGEPKLSSNDSEAYAGVGLVWNAQRGIYWKPIANGKKHFCKDPKTGKRWVE